MKKISASEFDSEVLASKQPVVVDFYTDSCPPCRALSPILQEWENESGNSFKVVKVDAAAEYTLAASYGVTAVPALFLFSNGKVVAQSLGLKSKNSLKQWAGEALRPVAP
jgi:thioredoxin